MGRKRFRRGCSQGKLLILPSSVVFRLLVSGIKDRVKERNKKGIKSRKARKAA